MNNELPTAVAQRDRELQAAGDELAELRWHWTRNTDNPERVTFREYGRQVGRDPAVIRAYAVAHELSDEYPEMSASERARLAGFSPEKRSQIVFRAEQDGVSIQSAQGRYDKPVTHRKQPNRRLRDASVVLRAVLNARDSMRTIQREWPNVEEWSEDMREAVIGGLRDIRHEAQALDVLAGTFDYDGALAELLDGDTDA